MRVHVTTIDLITITMAPLGIALFFWLFTRPIAQCWFTTLTIQGHGGGFMDTLGFGGRQECFKCEGKGFFHDSSVLAQELLIILNLNHRIQEGAMQIHLSQIPGMNHDAGPNSRCFFCKDRQLSAPSPIRL